MKNKILENVKFPLKPEFIYCECCGKLIAKYYKEIDYYERVKAYGICKNCGFFYCAVCLNLEDICKYCKP